MESGGRKSQDRLDVIVNQRIYDEAIIVKLLLFDHHQLEIEFRLEIMDRGLFSDSTIRFLTLVEIQFENQSTRR